MSRTVRVDLRERGYDIRIGTDLAPGAALSAETARRVLLISDEHVAALYGERCAAQLAARGLEVRRATVPAGEGSKDLSVVRRLYDACVEAGLDRRSVIAALGGGVVGDVAGFVAATYLRGIPYLQIPTTLLAMVDSAVGGKVGVNLPQGKNLVGAFHQPLEVCADLTTLGTLPEREYVSGLAEVVKCGVIWDVPFFERLERRAAELRRREAALLEEVVARCCEIKAEVVAVDERESGVRSILNFGHTLGHAVEQAAGYGRWLHGEAVALGMAFAAELSVLERGLRAEEAARLKRLLAALQLPVAPPADLDWAALRGAMATDKKARGGAPRFVLADKLGAVVFGCEPAEENLARAFQRLRE